MTNQKYDPCSNDSNNTTQTKQFKIEHGYILDLFDL